MREIKFRFITSIGQRHTKTLDQLREGRCVHKSDDFSGMYTGLKDINGVEIYEGDKVMDRTNYDDLYETRGLFKDNKVICVLEVKWHKEMAGFYLENKKHEYKDWMRGLKLEIVNE